MKQLKIPVAIFLALVLLVLAAVLPMAVGWIQDSRESEAVRYAPISELQLKLYSGDMTLLEKLAVAAKSEESYVIPVSMASMTSSEAMEQAELALAPYEKLGMFRDTIDLSHQLDDISPLLVYTSGDDARSFVCWGVSISAEYWSIYLVMDDETGVPLSIDYTVSDKNGGYDWDWTSTDVMMDVLIQYFYDLYSGALGEEFITGKLGQSNPKFLWEAETIYCPIQWEDAQLGDITLILRVTPYGFNTTIY